MNFFSLGAVRFLLVFLVLTRYVLKSAWRRSAMTVAAVLFIFMQETPHWGFTLFFIAVTFAVLGIGWAMGRRIAADPDDAGKKRRLVRGTILVFSPLVIFKLVQIVLPPQLIEAVLALKGGIQLGSLAPLGISYFCFRSVAYLIEIRQGGLAPVSWWEFVNYAAFWPTMPAGPIERPKPFFDQMSGPLAATPDDLREGFARILAGVAKKMILGEFFYRIANPYILLSGMPTKNGLESWPVWHLWLCVHAYYLYLYCDFSGYSDVAIGLSRMFGVRIMENFRWPILATDVADFWRRWHISLTGWITEYVYFGLGGNREGEQKAARNTFIAMGLVGVWHGLAPHFLLWGLYHAFFLNLYRRMRRRDKLNPKPKTRLRTAVAWFVTFQIINLGWVLFIFGAKQSLQIYARLFGL